MSLSYDERVMLCRLRRRARAHGLCNGTEASIAEDDFAWDAKTSESPILLLDRLLVRGLAVYTEARVMVPTRAGIAELDAGERLRIDNSDELRGQIRDLEGKLERAIRAGETAVAQATRLADIQDCMSHKIAAYNRLESDLAAVRTYFGEKAYNEALAKGSKK